MAEDITQKYRFDISEVLNGLDAGIKKLDAFDAAVRQAQNNGKQAFAQLGAETDRYAALLTEQIAETRANAAAQKDMSEAVKGFVQQLRDEQEAQAKASAAAREANRQKREAAATAKAAAAAAKEQEQREREAAAAAAEQARQAKIAAVAATGIGRAWQTVRNAAVAARDAVREEKIATDQAEQSTSAFGRAWRAASASIEASVKAAKEAKKATQEQAAATKQGEKANSGFGLSLGGLKGLVAGAFSAAAIKAFIGEVVDAGKQADATLSKLQFARGGSAQDAARDLANIRFEADRLGLDLNSTGNSYGSFTAAAKAGNFPLSEARRLFLATAGAASQLKLSSNDTEGVLVALTQVLSKGKVAAEELRGQIGERLPGAFSIAARAMNVTEAELNKMLETGKVTAQDFLPKFARELEKTFGEGTTAAADTATANFNRIGNEYEAFLLRFQSLSGRGAKLIADAFKDINLQIDFLTQEGRARIGEQNAQAQIKQYTEFTELLFKQVTAAAKRGGRDVSAELQQAADVQRAELERQIAEAEKGLKLLENPSEGGFLDLLKPEVNKLLRADGRKFDPSSSREIRDALREEEVVLQTRKKAAEGNLAILREQLETATKVNNANIAQLGIIAELEEKIKRLKKEREDVTLKGGGEVRIFALNKEIDAAQKELDRLLGKVDKGKKEVDKLTPALRALEAERAKLRKEADKRELEDLRDQGQARAKEQLRQDFNSIKQLEDTLKAKEAAVRKAGGRGADADGVIDGVQSRQLAELRQLAVERYYAELRKIAQDHADKLFALQADSDEKEREAIERKYEQQAQDARGQADLLVAIEQAKQRELLALQFKQTTERINRQEEQDKLLAQQRIGLGGVGTGLSEIQAERAQKRALLEVELKYLRDKLNATLLTNDAIGVSERARLKIAEQEIKKSLNQLKREEDRDKFNIYRLVFGDADSPENRQILDDAFAQFKGALDSILQAELDNANARIDVRSRNISELQNELQAQIELSKTGAASDIQATRDKLNAEKAARREAIEDQKKAARAQRIVQDLTALSSLGVAVANIIASWSTVPYVGSLLGLAAAGATITGYIITRQKAKAAVESGSNSAGFFQGGFTGGSSIHEERGVVHGKEHVMDHKGTAKYGEALLEPLRLGRPEDINWALPQLQAILPNYDVPKQMQQEQQRLVVLQQQQSLAPLQEGLAKMEGKLGAIEKHVATSASRPDIIGLREGQLIIRYPNGSEQLVNYPVSFRTA